MADSNSQVWLASVGKILIAPVDTAAPTDLATPDVGWESPGYLSRENLPELGQDGGDSSVLGVWQVAALREVQTEQAVDFLNFNLAQFSRTGLGLYYGGTGGVTETEFTVGTVTKTEKALLLIIEDSSQVGGTTARLGFYVPRASIGRNDSVSLATDNFAELPLRATFLQSATITGYRFKWIGASLDETP